MAHTHLQKTAWVSPKSYAGYDPVGHYIIAIRHRDSGLLESANWDAIIREMGQPASLYDNGPMEASLYAWSVGHWAVGWVEYLTLKPDAPADLLDKAEAILAGLAEYPVVDDELMYERETNAIYDYWQGCDLRERITMLAACGDSIFVARRNSISAMPTSTLQHIQDQLPW